MAEDNTMNSPWAHKMGFHSMTPNPKCSECAKQHAFLQVKTHRVDTALLKRIVDCSINAASEDTKARHLSEKIVHMLADEATLTNGEKLGAMLISLLTLCFMITDRVGSQSDEAFKEYASTIAGVLVELSDGFYESRKMKNIQN